MAGEPHELNPGSGADLAPALDLFQMTITAFSIGETGSLSLDFDSGAKLVVTPHPRFEAWGA